MKYIMLFSFYVLVNDAKESLTLHGAAALKNQPGLSTDHMTHDIGVCLVIVAVCSLLYYCSCLALKKFAW